MTPKRAALIILIVSVLTILGAWAFQWAGYQPCPLCLKQRWAYYAVIPLSGVLFWLASTGRPYARRGLLLAALVMIASGIFGVYHAGVEWRWWPGPGTCGGGLSGGLPDLSQPVVSCDDAALRILGLSLAGWNAVISFALAALALIAARKPHGSSSVSQYR